MPNVIIIRSFSKFYGLAGLRVGYMACGPKVYKLLPMTRDYLGFNLFSDRMASACLRAHDAYQQIADRVVRERQRLIEFLAAIPGFTAFTSEANFVLLECPVWSTDYANFLATKGLIIKSYKDDPVFANHYRITIGPPSVMGRVRRATQEFAAVFQNPVNRPMQPAGDVRNAVGIESYLTT